MKKSKYLVIKVIFLFGALLIHFTVPMNLYAEGNGRIYGIVTEVATGDPLPGANCYLEGTALGTSTNLDGEFTILNIAPGSYTLKLVYIGYLEQELSVEVKSGETVTLDISMESTVLSTTEVVVVSAQREGQVAAINQQLTADAIKNVVSAERIREVPDANAAESVGRLPGIALGRSGGEGNKVVVRGLSAKYSKIAINGVAIPAAGTGGSDGISDDRSTDFSMISNESLSGIEVYKALTADMDGDAIGGVVNLQLAKARETPRRSIRLFNVYNAQENDARQYKVTANWSQRILNNSLGIQASINSELRNRTSEYLSADFELGSENEDGTNNMLMNEARAGEREEYRQRFGANLILDYDIGAWNLMLSNFYNHSNRDIKERENAYLKTNSDLNAVINNPERKINLLSNILEGRGLIGLFEVDWVLSHSRTTSEHLHDSELIFRQPGKIIDPLTDYEEVDPAQFLKDVIPDSSAYLDRTRYKEGEAVESHYMAAINLKFPYKITNKITGELKFGGKYKQNDRDKYSNDGGWSAYLDGLNIPVSTYFDSEYDPGTILDGRSSIGLILDPTLTYEFFEQYRANYEMNDFSQERYEARDQVSAAYLMTKLKFGQTITFIPGIRYEQFTGDYLGYHKYDIGHEAGLRVEQEEQITYNDWLPMVHLKIKPVDWFDLRLAVTKTLARANYDQLLPKLSVKTVTDALITMGNPDLREAISWNYDAYASIYHQKIGLFTFGYFYKALDGVIANSTHFITSDALADSLALPVSLDPNWTSYAHRRVRRPINIDESTIKGFEIEYQTNFSYLSWPFKGLVINANYTRIFSETKYSLFETSTEIDLTQRPPKVVKTYTTSLRSGRVPGQADHLANVSIGYDIKGFSARVSWSYQGESLASLGTQEEHDKWRGDFTRLSFSLRQKLGKGLSIYMNGINLTNQNDLTYRALDYPRPSSLSYYGATYDFGMEYRF